MGSVMSYALGLGPDRARARPGQGQGARRPGDGVSFDEKKTLGNKETGAVAALPIWMDSMRVALKGRESEDFAAPPPTQSAAAQKVDTPDDAESGDSEAH